MSSKNEIKIIRKRFKCSKCKGIESHSLGSNKTSCSKCGAPLYEISEKEYIQIKNKIKKNIEEDIKEIDNKELISNDKKKKKPSHKNISNEDAEEEQKEKKPKRKLKKNLSSCNIKDKEYKEYKAKKDEEQEEDNEENESNSKPITRKKKIKKRKIKNQKMKRN